ncbi:MAG TPA: IclR family transcriptional regulator [Candidatus Dormibacteraeota bacterium]|nr:IclR family transcriptional regulator [Candidatus Dormibacteraeota bacterium]
MPAGVRHPVSKVLSLLRWMAEAGAGPWGVREIADGLDMSPSTVHRVLSLLHEEGFVYREQGGRYGLGVELYRIAHSVTNSFSLHRIALRHLRELVATCNETSALCVYRPDTHQMMFATVVESPHPIRYIIETNRWGPLHAGASGLAILAFLPEVERREVVWQSALPPMTDRTITDPGALERRLDHIRQLGYAISRGERTPGAVGIAAPIFGPDGVVLGDVLVTLPEARFDPTMEPGLAGLAMRCANAITLELQGQPRARSSSAG